MGRRRVIALALVVLLAAATVSPAVPAAGAEAPYSQRWRVQSEVGGDIGGRSELAVTSSVVTMSSSGGTYSGTVSYGDRLIVEDPQGGVFVQVSRMALDLTGAPAAGGAGMGGLFEGTARLDDYLGLTWKQATSGDLPAQPTRSGLYTVAGRWGAFLSGDTARGELLFETAGVTSKTGDVDVHDASWFNRFGTDAGQPFQARVAGAVAPGGASAGGGVSAGGSRPTPFAYVRAGLASDVSAGYPAAVPLASALSAKALRDAKPKGATALPANSVTVDLDVSGLLLDAKNRATGQRADSSSGKRASAVWRAARKSARASSESTASQLAALLEKQEEIDGSQALLRQVEELAGTKVSADTTVMLGEWLFAARAAEKGAKSVLGPSAAAAIAVRDTPVPRSGAAADGLLADADSPAAPVGALDVARFERDAPADVPFVKDGRRVVYSGDSGPIPAVLASARLRGGAPAVEYSSARGRTTIAPASWLAYRRADGVTCWLAGKSGAVAMRAGPLPGWAYRSTAMRLVASNRCGEVLEMLRAGAPEASTEE